MKPLDAERQALVLSHMWLAQTCAWKAARTYANDMPADELLSICYFALTYAASKYDETKGTTFKTYATLAVRHCLSHGVAKWRSRTLERIPTIGDDNIEWEPEANIRTGDQIVATDEIVVRVRRCLAPRSFDMLFRHAQHESLTSIGESYGIGRARAGQIVSRARNDVLELNPRLAAAV